VAIVVARRLRPNDIRKCLIDLFVEHKRPEHIRSDNGLEFAAKAVRHWLGKLGVKTLFIGSASPLGEWLSRKRQLQAQRRTAQRSITSNYYVGQATISRLMT
jgi:hypothetical protein